MHNIFSRIKKPDCKNQLDAQLWFIPKGNPYDSEGKKVARLSHRCNSHLPFWRALTEKARQPQIRSI